MKSRVTKLKKTKQCKQNLSRGENQERKKSRLNLPPLKMLIADRVARGFSQRMIARELQTSQPANSRIIRQNDVQEITREEKSILVKQISEIVELVRNDPKVIEAHRKWFEKKKLLNFRWA